MNHDRFTLTIDPPHGGWLNFRFHFVDSGDREFLASFLSEPLADLLAAANTIARGRGTLAEDLRMTWVEEPGCWIITLSSAEPDELTIRFAEFPTWPAPLSQTGRELLVAIVPAGRFCRCVLRATDTMIQAIGIDGYEQQWRRRFPAEALERLRATIGSSNL